jgi:uncharacterized membrane protein YkoI
VHVVERPTKNRRRRRVVAGSALTVGLALGGGALYAVNAGASPAETADNQGEAAYTQAHRADARTTQAEAEAAAQQAKPGRLFDSHLQNEGEGLRWEVKSDDGTTVWEIQVDASSGRVVSVQHDE